MRVRRSLLVGMQLGWVLTVSAAGAQQTTTDTAFLIRQQAEEAATRRAENDAFHAELERSYITVLGGFGNIDPLLFEANIAPAFVVTQWSRGAVVVTPKVILRMRKAYSDPVQSPSYMPRATLYLFSGRIKPDTIHFLAITFSHHSNGQAGPFTLPNGQRNLVDGNFSTNFVQMLWQGGENGRDHRLLGVWRVGAEYHIRPLMDDSLRGRYSDFRPLVGFQSIPKHNLGLTLDVAYLATGYPGLGVWPRFQSWLTLELPPLWRGNLSVFANGYSGKDYYNIYFERSLSVLRIGLMTNPQGSSVVRPSFAPR